MLYTFGAFGAIFVSFSKRNTDQLSSDSLTNQCYHDAISLQVATLEEDKSLCEARESALEQKITDSNEKILKVETFWLEAQALCKTVNEQLAETQAQFEALDKKYNKAKKLLKDYQQKWVCWKGQCLVIILKKVNV